MISQNIIINSIELSICWFLLHCNTIPGWVMAFREPPNPPKPGRISLKLQEGTNLRYSFSSIEGRSTPLTTTTQYALPSRWLWNIVRLLLQVTFRYHPQGTFQRLNIYVFLAILDIFIGKIRHFPWRDSYLTLYNHKLQASANAVLHCSCLYFVLLTQYRQVWHLTYAWEHFFFIVLNIIHESSI